MNSKIITIDGPSGVGKGTLAKNLSDELGWIVLDSGSLYRLVAYLSLKNDTKDFSETVSYTHQTLPTIGEVLMWGVGG